MLLNIDLALGRKINNKKKSINLITDAVKHADHSQAFKGNSLPKDLDRCLSSFSKSAQSLNTFNFVKCGHFKVILKKKNKNKKNKNNKSNTASV